MKKSDALLQAETLGATLVLAVLLFVKAFEHEGRQRWVYLAGGFALMIVRHAAWRELKRRFNDDAP